MQLPPQARSPLSPQTSVWLASQSPSLAHADHSDHVPLLHVRMRVPQLPQASVSGPEQA
jgi:hypothetical protein